MMGISWREHKSNEEVSQQVDENRSLIKTIKEL